MLLLSLVAVAAILSELGVKFVLGRALVALPFTLAALPLAFTVEGRPWMRFPLGVVTLTITDAGVERPVSVAVRSWGSVVAVVVLAGSTPFPQLLVAMRALRLPRLPVSIVGLMWRYLFVLVDEAARLLRARAARSGARGRRRTGGSLGWRAHVTGSLVGTLFLRAFDRADRIYAAMVARGYDGEVRTLPLPPLDAAAWATLTLGLSLLGALVALGELPQTMLVTTHDMALVRALFPRTVVLDEGRIVADGPTAAVLDDVTFLEAHGLA